ncbi:hypothetical protein [Nonomuraea sp. LPB2021202275-12-8]|uniref:hypothetical protein n=1 Tax=Nonomuraea sp. LPB2021202275-12-8 TaxID=3120159 RepID=UPI00300C6C04
MRRFMVILAAVAALAVGGLPASASGGWAVTYLDPAPGKFAPGASYTIGFWVLQHGTHPFEGDLGRTGLTLTGADGTQVTYNGTPLPEAGHYATAVNLPKGTYEIEAVQGMFQPYEVGTLTVPGDIKINPVPPEMVGRLADANKDYWGAIRPPGFPAGKGGPEAPAQVSAEVSAPATAPLAPVEAAERPAASAEAGGFPMYALLLAAVGGALLALAAVRLPRLRREPDPPADEPEDLSPDGSRDGKADTIVING